MQDHSSAFYLARDGTRLWYQTFGTGPVTLILSDGVGCAGYIWQYFIPYFADSFRILHSQYRGHGRSAVPKDLSTMSIEQFAEDLAELIAVAAPEGPVVLLGHSMGVQVALEYYHRFPSRVQALVLVNGPHGHALSHVHNTAIFAQALPTLRALAFRWKPYLSRVWKPLLDSELSYYIGLVFEVNPFLTKRKDFRPYFKELGSLDPQAFLAAISHATAHSAWDILPSIKVPVLVIASEKDRFTPYPIVKSMFDAIPHAELLNLPTASHIGPLELPELVNLRIEKFLASISGTQIKVAKSRAKAKANVKAKTEKVTRKAK